MEHRIIVAGIGPGHPDYVLPAAARAIREARVLVGGARALADFARPGQRTMTIRGDIPAVLSFIRESLTGDDVVAIVSGDPGYYSLLDALRREFPADSLVVIPGISSIQFAFARLALPWHDASLLSFHGRQPAAGELEFWPGRSLGLLTDTKYNSRTISALLLEHGWPRDTKAAVCSRLSYEDETVWRTTLGEAAQAEEKKNCVMVVTG